MWQHFFRVLHFHYNEFNIGITILHMQCYYVWISCSVLFQIYLYTMKFFVFSFFFLLLLHYWSSSLRMFLLFHTTQNQMLYSTTISEIYMCMRVTLFYLWSLMFKFKVECDVHTFFMLKQTKPATAHYILSLFQPQVRG